MLMMIVEAKEEVVLRLPPCQSICTPWLHSNKSKIHLQGWMESRLNLRRIFVLLAAS